MKLLKRTSNLYLLLFLCLSNFSIAQNTQNSAENNTNSVSDSISKKINSYFELERESIHVHFNKNLFFTNENIWFKGYVRNNKLNLPFYSTTNVYVQILNESGAIIESQLLYCMSGFFSGQIKLNPNYQSGYYYIQFYTNWMNNFSEDESFVQKIKIKHSNDTTIPLIESLNYSKIHVDFYPEGGKFIANQSNTIGVKITDSNGNPIPNLSVDIIDKNNQLVKTVATNTFGMGKTDITPNLENYTAKLTYKESTFAYNLPTVSKNGITLKVINYVFDDKTIIDIKFDSESKKKYSNKLCYIVIQQNEKSNIFDINSEDNNYFFLNESFFPGINYIRIIDEDLNELANRIIYKERLYSTKLNTNYSTKSDDLIKLSGNSTAVNSCLSASILPVNSISQAKENSFLSFVLNAFLQDKLNLDRSYFNILDRNKKVEIDLMLLTQSKIKYDWENIKRNPPTNKYVFEKGLDIKGVINTTKANTKKCIVELKNILNEVLENSKVNEKNEFFFENTSVTDSLLVYCDLIDFTERKFHQMNYNLVITNKKKKYNQNYLPIPYSYPKEKDASMLYDFNIELFDDNSILLNEVEIKNEKRKLKRETQSGNSFLRGFKVGEDVNENMSLLNFIEQNGFDVVKDRYEVKITGRTKNSILGPPSTPFVFLDGYEVYNFDQLSGVTVGEFEEIYISAQAFLPSSNNKQGIIKLYSKPADLTSPNAKNKSVIISNGFEVIKPFTNAEYTSEFTTGFEKFGIIHWIPWILTDENGNLNLSLPNKNHKKIKVIIEGLTIDGEIISEIKEINLE